MIRRNIHIEYSCFDIDDNLLHMPTKINMINIKTGKKEKVSSEMFASIRSDKDNWKLSDDAFIEFGDNGPRGHRAFIEDLIKAVSSSEFAPSWYKFIKTLENAYLFALITARGASADSIRIGIEWIIDNYLSKDQKYSLYNNCLKFKYLFESESNDNYKKILSEDDLNNISKNVIISSYLDNCGFYGVSNDNFLRKHNTEGAESPEMGKEIALKEFIKNVKTLSESIGATISIGMSDDDIKNITHIEKVFNDLKKIYPDTIFRLYDTSKRGYKKKIIEGHIIKDYSKFLENQNSSVMSMLRHNNVTNQNWGNAHDNLRRQVEFINGELEEVIGLKPYKRKKRK